MEMTSQQVLVISLALGTVLKRRRSGTVLCHLHLYSFHTESMSKYTLFEVHFEHVKLYF